jgi:acyl dehydratase
VGDVLDATLTVDNVRDVSGNGFYTTTTRITDDAGELVCTARATLVHRAAA